MTAQTVYSMQYTITKDFRAYLPAFVQNPIHTEIYGQNSLMHYEKLHCTLIHHNLVNVSNPVLS